MMFSPTKPWMETSKALNEIVDAAWKTVRDADPPRKYLGGSAVGGHCERQLGYEFHKYPKDDGGFSGRLYRIFDRGHQGEERVAKYLRAAGFELVTEKEDGRQFGFMALGGRFAGHIDGIITGGPMPVQWPALWENKILNDRSFIDLQNHGLKKSKPVYYAQVNLYMAYMELDVALFTAENADTCELHSEVVPLDVQHAQAMSDRAVRIVASEKPTDLARCTGDPSDYRCKMCSWSKTCWQASEKSPTAITPPWLEKK